MAPRVLASSAPPVGATTIRWAFPWPPTLCVATIAGAETGKPVGVTGCLGRSNGMGPQPTTALWSHVGSWEPNGAATGGITSLQRHQAPLLGDGGVHRCHWQKTERALGGRGGSPRASGAARQAPWSSSGPCMRAQGHDPVPGKYEVIMARAWWGARLMPPDWVKGGIDALACGDQRCHAWSPRHAVSGALLPPSLLLDELRSTLARESILRARWPQPGPWWASHRPPNGLTAGGGRGQ